MNTIHNARLTLAANLLNTMAGSSFTVGVAAPIAAVFFYNPAGVRPLKVLLGGIIWTLVAGLLDLFAQAVLGRLRS